MEIIDLKRKQKNRIRLRPVSPISRDEMVQKNLMPFKENMSIKKLAQENFYDKQITCLPLVCSPKEKVPIHNRLGLFNHNKRKIPLFGTNTAALLPRNKQKTKGKNTKIFIAKRRPHRVWRQQNNQSQILFTTSFLKRILMNCNIPNLKVELFNEMKHPEVCSRFKLCLSHVYQEEIRQIQLAHPRQIIHGVYPIIPVTTSITMNERFSHLL